MSLDGLETGARPNVLVVTVDCLRPDFLGCYDSSAGPVAPTVDRLADTGHRFDNAFANASQTPISFPSLFTANYPLSHGGPHYLSDDRVFVAEWFQRQGYRTAGFSTNHWLSYTANYPRGFDEYREYYKFHEKVRGHVRYLVEKGYADGKSLGELESELVPVVEQRYRAALEGTEAYLEEVDWASERVVRAHEALEDERALLTSDFEAFVEAIDADLARPGLGERIGQRVRRVAGNVGPLRTAHRLVKNTTQQDGPPREKPMTDAETVTDDVVDHLEDAAADEQPLFLWMHYMDAHRPYLPGSSDDWENEYQQYLDAVGESVTFADANEQLFDAYEALYRGCIRYVDTQLQRVVAAARELQGETVVVLTADHGEEFREHGNVDHNAKLYDELVHVPLVVSRLGSETGATHPELVSHVDLLPSIYSALVPDATVPASIDGQDVFASARDAVLAETLRTATSPEHPHHVGQHLSADYRRIAVRTHDEKVIYHEDDDSWQQYDLEADPAEQRDLAPEGLNQRLRERVLDRERAIEAAGATTDERREQPDIVQDRLQDLGYSM